ncbi:hypothetical protein Tco_0913505 [Tanacetum coccineum]
MDDPNITMEEYIRLEEEKAHRRGKVYNWETAMYGKIGIITVDMAYSLNEYSVFDTGSIAFVFLEFAQDLNERKEIDELVEISTSLEVLES